VDVSTVLTSSVVAAGVTFFLNQGTKLFEGKRAAKDNALYAAISLEEWTVACFNVWGNVADYKDSQGQIGIWHGQLPEMVDLRKEIELSKIGLGLRGQILTLIARVKLANTAITEDLQQFKTTTTDEKALELGLEAARLAHSIRAEYGLRKVSDKMYDNAVARLNSVQAQLLEKKAKQAAQIKALFKKTGASDGKKS